MVGLVHEGCRKRIDVPAVKTDSFTGQTDRYIKTGIDPGVIFQADGIGPRTFLIIKVKIGIGIEDIIWIPYRTDAPVDPLPPYFQGDVIVKPFQIQPVDHGVQHNGPFVVYGPAEVEKIGVIFNEIHKIVPEEFRGFSYKQTGAQCSVDPELIRWIPAEIEAVMDKVIDQRTIPQIVESYHLFEIPVDKRLLRSFLLGIEGAHQKDTKYIPYVARNEPHPT